MLGKPILILDNLSCSRASVREAFLKQHFPNTPVIHGDVGCETLLDELFHSYKITTVVHLAALKSIKESQENPNKYYLNNIDKSVTLLEKSSQNKVSSFIFASTASVYYQPRNDEMSPVKADNPYSGSKLFVEGALKKCFNFPFSCSLRITNPVGHISEELSDNGRDNLIPRFFGNGEFFLQERGLESRDFLPISSLVKIINEVVSSELLGHHCWNVSTSKNTLIRNLIYNLNKELKVRGFILERPMSGKPINHIKVCNDKILDDLYTSKEKPSFGMEYLR